MAAALRRLIDGSHSHLFSGLLYTIELRNDPVETYESLAEFEPPRIDFRRVCGGGLYGHRYRPRTGFASPSMYCPKCRLPARMTGPT